MLHYAFLSVLLATSILDLAFHGGTSFAPWALLYVGLKIQADWAADRFLRHGLPLRANPDPEASWMPPPNKDPFATPWQEPVHYLPPPECPKAEPPKKEPPKTERKEAKPRKKTAPYRAPKFHGPPHEVLGIDPDANTNVIVKAFRHWIKEFHPDHLRPGQESQRATDRARTITSAKESLLDRRRQMRKAA